MVAMLTCGYSSAHAAPPPAEQAAEIIHQPLQCWPAEEHVVLSIDVQPAGDVQKNLVYFRWDRNAVWYFVPMFLNAQGAWVAVLPRTAPDTTGVVYFFESMSSSYMATRSDEVRAPVSSRCKNAAAVIYTGTNPNITLGATGGPPLAPGFQASGITSFISPSGMTTGATGAGGGVSGRTMALIGGAGGAAAVFALAGGGGDGGTTTTMDAIGGITSTAGTTTTVTGGGGPSSTTTTAGGGGPTTTTTGGGGSTSTIIVGGSTTTGGGSSTTTGGGSSTTTSGASSTTTSGGSSTTTIFGSTTTSGGSSTTTTGGSTTSSATTSVTTSVSTSVATTSVTTSVATSTTSGTTLSVSKRDSTDPVAVGGTTFYTITVRNTGPVTATSVFMRDVIPSSMSIGFLSPSSCRAFGQEVLCPLSDIAAGSSKDVRIGVTLNSAGTFTNTARGSASNAAAVFGSETTTVTSTLRSADERAATLALKAFLDVEPYDGKERARIIVNGGSPHEIDNSGARVLRVDGRIGRNALEATPPSGVRDGYWRLDFAGSSGFVAGSIRVQSGQAMYVSADSAVFHTGPGAPPVRITFDLQ